MELTILLLGAYGFLGTNVMKYVDNCGLPYRFITFDRTLQHPQGVSFDCVKKSYSGDFSDVIAVDRIFEEHEIDIVIHSISTTVPLTSGSIRYDVESNLLPTISLLDCMVRHNVKKIVFFSSGGAIYGDSNSCSSHRETDELYPKSSYGVVKLAIEKYLFLYKSLYGLQPMVLRLSNPYGKWHYSQRQGIINIALRAAQKGEKFNVWGDGSATKDYIYVGDLCEILYKLITCEAYGEVINVASGELLSVNEILYQIKAIYPQFDWHYEPSNVHDVSRVMLDNTRMKQLVGTINMHTLKQIIATL